MEVSEEKSYVAFPEVMAHPLPNVNDQSKERKTHLIMVRCSSGRSGTMIWSTIVVRFWQKLIDSVCFRDPTTI